MLFIIGVKKFQLLTLVWKLFKLLYVHVIEKIKVRFKIIDRKILL